jgi:hypothetical protein
MMSVRHWMICISLVAAMPAALTWAADATAVDKAYWCPGQSGKEIRTKPGPGCEPLFDEKSAAQSDKPPLRADDIEGAVGRFLQDYRQFLSCCKEDPDAYDKISELHGEATHLLNQVTKAMHPTALLMTRNQGFIQQVAQARDQLRLLKDRLKKLDAEREKRDTVDFEGSRRQRLTVEDEERALRKDFESRSDPSRAPTGSDIGRSAPTGSSIGRTPATGADIGNTTLPAKIGPEGESGNLPSRVGEENAGTNLPSRMGPDIGGGNTPASTIPNRTGSEIGDSNLNQSR